MRVKARNGLVCILTPARQRLLLPISAVTRVFDALLGEKDGMRGFGSRGYARRSEPPHPGPLPCGEREPRAAPLCAGPAPFTLPGSFNRVRVQ